MLLKSYMFKRKEKILTEIISPSGIKRKNCIIEGNKIIIKRGKGVRGDPTISAGFDKDCILLYSVGVGPFKRWKRKLIWKEGSTNCVDFKGGRVKVGYEDVKEYFEAGAIKNAGATLQTIKAPTLLYVAIFALIFLQIIGILISSGKVVIA